MNARIVPFLAYVVFLVFDQLLSSIIMHGGGDVLTFHIDLWLYPIKTGVVLGLLLYFWPDYQELKGKKFNGAGDVTVSVVVGILVYLAWVRMDWPWAMQSGSGEKGYDPFQAGAMIGAGLAGIRVFGAAVVVPLMEELFWRSFLIRYIISSKFDSVPLGVFTPLSFALTVVLFGFEHDLWLAGMMAGVAYNGLLYYTKKLWPCILAHAVTNLALGIHVLLTAEWQWW